MIKECKTELLLFSIHILIYLLIPELSINSNKEIIFAYATDIPDICVKQHLQGMYSCVFYKFRDWIFGLIAAYLKKKMNQHARRLPAAASNLQLPCQLFFKSKNDSNLTRINTLQRFSVQAKLLSTLIASDIQDWSNPFYSSRFHLDTLSAWDQMISSDPSYILLQTCMDWW